MITHKEAYSLVGKPFVQFTEDNKAWGCLAPYYLIHPEFKDFFTLEDTQEFLKLAKERFKEISLEEIQYGDFIALLMPLGLWHIMIYLGDGKYVHCTKATGTVVEKLSPAYKNRIKGVFRWA